MKNENKRVPARALNPERVGGRHCSSAQDALCAEQSSPPTHSESNQRPHASKSHKAPPLGHALLNSAETEIIDDKFYISVPLRPSAFGQLAGGAKE